MINTDPLLTKTNIETDPRTTLIETAISIAEYRKNTSGENYKYQRYQEEGLQELYNESFRFSTDIHDCQPGRLLEALFYINMHQLGVPITLSTGEQDAQRIDFFVLNHSRPLVVMCNTNPQIITNKLRRESSSVIFIPQFPKQQSIKQYRAREYILNHFAENMLTPERYLQIMLTINTEFKDILMENLINKFNNHRDLRIKKVKKRDIYTLDNTLHRFSRVLQQLQ